MTAVAPDDAPGPDSPELGPGFWIAVVVGGALMAWGGYLFIDATAAFDQRLNFVGYLVGAAVVHDLAVAPVVCGVGLLTARLVPGRARAPVQAGFIASGAVLVVAILPLRGTADAVGNDTIQPLNYATATLTALAIVWVAAGAWLAVRLWRSRAPEGRDPA